MLRLILPFIILLALTSTPLSSIAAQTVGEASEEKEQDEITAPAERETGPQEVLERPFDAFAGWWSGIGRIGHKGKTAEPMRCRATYFVKEKGQKLTQNLRCSTQSVSLYVKSEVRHEQGKLIGSWHEEKYNIGGEITGKIDKSGMTLFVKGDDLAATMHVVTKGNRQIVEIDFDGLDVVGISIIFKKG